MRTALFVVGLLTGFTAKSAALYPDTPTTNAEFSVERAEELAKAALNDGDANALRDLKLGAKDHVAAAQYGLALFDFSSTMFISSDSTAGDGIAQTYLLLQQSAAQSFPAAEYRLCWFLGSKSWGKFDPEVAAQWCERASNQGIAAADLMLGEMALSGAYIPPCPSFVRIAARHAADRLCSEKAAITHLRRAALAGSLRAQFKLGNLLREKGRNLEEQEEAARWLILAAAQAEVGDDDAWIGEWVRKPDWATPPAACAVRAELPIPQADLPPPAAIQGLADCNSEQLYFGIGHGADVVNARWCAYLERPAFSSGNGWGAPAFAGPAILTMIYANGEGVERSRALAEKFACEMRGSPAELTGRIEHLEQPVSEANPGHFDVCDDAMSGEMGSNCTARDGQIADVQRLDRIDALKKRFSGAQRSALQSLLKASEDFFSAQSSGETDLTGSGRDGFVVQQYEVDEKAFESLLDEVATRPLAAVPQGAAKDAASQLAAKFRQVARNPDLQDPLAPQPPYHPYGTVSAHDVGVAQQAWKHYRNAWMALYAALYPNQSSAPIDVAITRERLQQLSQFAEH